MFLKTSLIVAWLVITAITVYAISTLGINFLPYFVGDMLTHGWRLQFNTDLVIHIGLLCFWIIWREENRTTGYICAALCMLGGVFTCLYLLSRLHNAEGSIKGLLLGRHA